MKKEELTVTLVSISRSSILRAISTVTIRSILRAISTVTIPDSVGVEETMFFITQRNGR
jgi:hypothetical protein